MKAEDKSKAVRALTEDILVGAVVGLAVWDLVADRLGGDEATESAVIRDAGHRHPIIAVAVGVAIGHWFWGRRGKTR